jgi:hypothetical protein
MVVNSFIAANNYAKIVKSYLIYGYQYQFLEEKRFNQKIKYTNKLKEISDNFKITKNENFSMVYFRFHDQ